MENNSDFLEKIKDLSGNDLKKEIAKKKVGEMILMVQRQTDYDETTIKKKLVEFNFNALMVIEDYLNIEKKKKTLPKSVNQKTFYEIRNFMDTGMRNYEKRKEMEEYINKTREEMSNQKVEKD